MTVSTTPTHTASQAMSGARFSVWWIVGLSLLTAGFEGVDIQAAGLVAPRIAPLFHMTPVQMGYFFSASTLGLVLGAVVGGRLADQLGRKRTLIISAAAFGVASLATTLATSGGALTGLRLLTGFGLGGALPNLIALSSESVPARQRNLAVGLMYCGMPFGGGLVSLLLGLGVGHGDWRTVFYIGGLAPLATLPLLMLMLPASPSLAHRPGGALRGVGTRALFGEGRAPTTLALWVAFFLGMLVLHLLLNWLPSLLVSRGLAKTQASMVQAVFNLFGGLSAIAVGFLMDSRIRRIGVAAAFAALAIGLVLLANGGANFGLALACSALVGGAAIGSQGVFYGLSSTTYPRLGRGFGLGAAVAAGRLGSMVGPLFAGVLVGAGRSTQEVLFALLPMVLIAGLLALALAWRAVVDHDAIAAAAP